MSTITSVAQLKASIKILEERQIAEKNALKEELKATAERLKPSNLIKNALEEYAQTPDLDATIGLAAGYLTKRAIAGTSGSPVKQLIGNLLQLGVSKLITNNAGSLKSTVLRWAERLLGKNFEKSKND